MIIAGAWAAMFTGVILYIMKITVRIDVETSVEEKGLDISQMGEQAYDDELLAVLDLGSEALSV